MYHIFFQPFEAVDAIKKGSTRAFAVMCLVASALGALAITLVLESRPGWASWPTVSFPVLAELNTVQLFLLLLVAIYVGNLIRAFILNLVMKIFTDKGAYSEAFKIVTVVTFIPSVYMLILIILGAIPEIGLGLSVIGMALTMLITLSILLRAIASVYKTDIATAAIAMVIIMVSMMVCMKFGYIGAKGSFKMMPGYKTMMQQAK